MHLGPKVIVATIILAAGVVFATYPAAQVPLDRVFAAKDAAYLNLITCTGEWNKGKQEYAERLVVYAVLAQ